MMPTRLPVLALLLALALAAAGGANAAVPENAPRLRPETRAMLADGDSLTRAMPPAANATASVAAASPVLISRVPADVPQAALEARLHGVVSVRARVSRLGLVDSVRVVTGDRRLRESALASARWWLFAPVAKPVWTTLRIDIDGRPPVDPLTPDVLAMAHEAERRGAWMEAIEAWMGALHRIGKHPSMLNEWAIRDHVIRLTRRLTSQPRVPGALLTRCQEARGGQFRTLARSEHQAFVTIFDDALLSAPWWADGYQWRAASLLNCGRGQDGMRTLMLFRTAAGDRTARSLADRAIAGLATGDTLGTAQLLKREGQQFNRDEDADH